MSKSSSNDIDDIFVPKQKNPKYSNEELHEIKNCFPQSKKICPLYWENLKPSTDEKTRFCNVCNQIVHRVTSKEELESFSSQSKCVMFKSHEVIDIEDLKSDLSKEISKNLEIMGEFY